MKWRISLVAALALLMAACEPPGKPTGEEDELKAPSDFKTIFAVNCSGCHGANGREGPGRVLNDPLYLAISTKENIRDIVVHGRPGTLMPAFSISNGGPLTDAQIATLVYGMEQQWAKPFSGTAIPAYDGAGLTGDVERGRKLFGKDCFACHAKGGVAGPIVDPTYLSLSSNQNLRTSIIVGRPDFPLLPMPDYRTLNTGHALADQDIADIVSFLASKRPAEAAQLNKD